MKTQTKPAGDFLGQEFIITREFEARRELVWRAWTDPKHLAEWWGPRGFTNPVCDWDVQLGKAIHVVMRAPDGARYPMGGEFREVHPPERLLFTTGALNEEGNLIFEFLHELIFTERKNRTLLTLKSRVSKTTPEAGKYIGGFEAGMSQSLEKLAEQLAAYTAPLVVERTFAAPVDLVWKALTTAEDLRRWYIDPEDFQPRAGFEFQFTIQREGRTSRYYCQVTKAVARKKLAYTMRFDDHTEESLVTFELFPEGDRTRLRLTHEGLDKFPPLPRFARENFLQGWTQIINQLKNHLESDRRLVMALLS